MYGSERRSSASARLLDRRRGYPSSGTRGFGHHHDRIPWPQKSQHFLEIGPLQCHTAFGGLEVVARAVKEDGASRSGARRVVIVGENHQQVVNTIVPPELLMAGRKGEGDGPVVVFRSRIVTPAILLADRRGG